KLQGFEFVQPPWSAGFSKLTIFELKELILPTGFYEGFLPLCPLLQELRVVDHNFNNLKPVFAAPSLKLLFFHSYFESIYFKNTPRLSVISILDFGEFDYTGCDDIFKQYNPDMVTLFASLPALEELNVGFELLLFLSDGHVPYQLPQSLHNLKVLEAPRILLGRLTEAQVLLCLIRSSPNLQKLTIVVGHDDDLYRPVLMSIDSLQMLLEHSHHFGVSCLQRLEEFDIKNTRGTRVEQDLLKFVLATALINVGRVWRIY
ncbi:F-box/FBD/LRR-repeat protein At1g13570, partial [Linum perenne]